MAIRMSDWRKSIHWCSQMFRTM